MYVDRRYIYLLRRVSKGKARIIDQRLVWNASRVEDKLHQIFDSQRIEINSRKRLPWFGVQVKIGIAKNPESRLKQINESRLSSGKTEWFLVSYADIMYLHFLFLFYGFILWIRLFQIITAAVAAYLVFTL